MAEPAIRTDEHLHHSKFLDANCAQNQAALDSFIGDPASNSTEDIADSEAPYPSSCHLLPQEGCVFHDPNAFFEESNAHSRAHVSCFPHPHSISALPSAQLQANCAGFPHPVALFEGAQTHLTTINDEGLTYPPQYLSKPSTVAARVPSGETSIHFLHKDQIDSTDSRGRNKDCASPHIKSNDSHAPPRVVYTGSAHVVAKCHDPPVQLSTEFVNSYEESASSHEEGEDSTVPQGSYEDLTFSHAGCDDSCDDSEGFTRGDSTNAHDDAQDPLIELLDPYFQQADADVTSILQPCSSECSSAVSMVTNTTSEITSRLDNTYMRVEGIESHWTDAEHGSYLDYMETSFVNNLYGREYCALDVCGQRPFHQVSKSSSPWPSTLFEFKSWQSGDWHRRSTLKPPLLTCIPLALRKSPWVNHFRHRKFSPARHQIKVENVSTVRGIDGEKEVNSPSIEAYKGAPGHDHASGSNFGHEERWLCKNGTSRGQAAGLPKQDGLQEFAHDTEIPSSANMKKRGIESNIEQGHSIRCRRDKFWISKCKD